MESTGRQEEREATMRPLCHDMDSLWNKANTLLRQARMLHEVCGEPGVDMPEMVSAQRKTLGAAADSLRERLRMAQRDVENIEISANCAEIQSRWIGNVQSKVTAVEMMLDELDDRLLYGR